MLSAPHPSRPDYRPSFTISFGAKTVYVDLVEKDKAGRSFYGLAYLHDCRWRRRFHSAQHSPYLQLKTADWNDESVFVRLSRFLKRQGITPRRLEEATILAHIIRTPQLCKELDAFIDYLRAYILQFKNSLMSFARLSRQLKQNHDAYARRRARAFLRLFRPLFYAYRRWLDDHQGYDFVDMINQATRAVGDIAECAKGYRYVLLDEAQDLSPNRFRLIKAILAKNPGCRFFAVGDDWQSIYRFTGSRLDLIYDFEQHFGLHTRRSLIEQTHRFGQPTIRVSCDFVTKNPQQVRKQIRGDPQRHTPVNVVLSSQRGNDTPALLRVLAKLHDEQATAFADLELQIISRYNHDISRLRSMPDFTVLSAEAVSWRGKIIPFCSMHKSKGITRDVVIVLNMNSTPHGMPATRETDPLSDLLLSRAENYAFAEERRLFYVAITRARHATYLIAERQHPSPFLFEISDELNELYQKLCPRCRSGELLRKGNISYCSNFRYGCDYLKRHPT